MLLSLCKSFSYIEFLPLVTRSTPTRTVPPHKDDVLKWCSPLFPVAFPLGTRRFSQPGPFHPFTGKRAPGQVPNYVSNQLPLRGQGGVPVFFDNLYADGDLTEVPEKCTALVYDDTSDIVARGRG